MVADGKQGIRFFVYALCEPDGKTIRYIGVTANLRDRYLKHVGSPQAKSLRQWIKSLESRGLIPSLIVLREVYGIQAAAEAEQQQIAHYSVMLGDQLLNEKHCGKPRPPRRGLIEFAGRRMTPGEWAAHLGISRQALNIRLNKYPVDIALSREKQVGVPLNGERWTKPVQQERETIILDVDTPTGLSHAQRRERRRMMAERVAILKSLEAVAREFGVTPETVRNALKEFGAIESSASYRVTAAGGGHE